jgi:uncharacterized protein YkwD
MIGGMRLSLLALAACGPMYAAPDPVPVPAPAPVPAPGPVPAPVAAPAAAPTGIPAAFVAEHNAVRAKHCAGPLTWSPKLAQYAQRWADTLKAKGCMFGHSNGNNYGENLAAGTVGALDPKGTVDYWYGEIKDYKFPNGGFSMTTGHFTQLVWRATTQVGCGHAVCNGNDVWVCEYDPPGNVDTEYRSNVLPTSCHR